MKTGIKHLIKCRCILPQFKSRSEPTNYSFAVFSVVDEDDRVAPKVVKCDNCGILHRVVDLCESSIVERESAAQVESVEDVKSEIDSRIVTALEKFEIDLATWELIRFTQEQQQWGVPIVISREVVGDVAVGRAIRLLGPGLFKFDSFNREEQLEARTR